MRASAPHPLREAAAAVGLSVGLTTLVLVLGAIAVGLLGFTGWDSGWIGHGRSDGDVALGGATAPTHRSTPPAHRRAAPGPAATAGSALATATAPTPAAAAPPAATPVRTRSAAPKRAATRRRAARHRTTSAPAPASSPAARPTVSTAASAPVVTTPSTSPSHANALHVASTPGHLRQAARAKAKPVAVSAPARSQSGGEARTTQAAPVAPIVAGTPAVHGNGRHLGHGHGGHPHGAAPAAFGRPATAPPVPPAAPGHSGAHGHGRGH